MRTSRTPIKKGYSTTKTHLGTRIVCDYGKDHTTEIIRCGKYIADEIKKGVKVSDAVIKAQSNYGWGIANASIKALVRNI